MNRYFSPLDSILSERTLAERIAKHKRKRMRKKRKWHI
jgi:Uri superfamily endonuclease